MKLPAGDHAKVSDAKILDYLLSDTHPDGGSKARFFRQLGYERASWQQLRDDLTGSLSEASVVALEPDEHGQKYVARAILKGPNGASARIRSIWIVEPEQTIPRLVTAYPGEET